MMGVYVEQHGESNVGFIKYLADADTITQSHEFLLRMVRISSINQSSNSDLAKSREQMRSQISTSKAK